MPYEHSLHAEFIASYFKLINMQDVVTFAPEAPNKDLYQRILNDLFANSNEITFAQYREVFGTDNRDFPTAISNLKMKHPESITSLEDELSEILSWISAFRNHAHKIAINGPYRGILPTPWKKAQNPWSDLIGVFGDSFISSCIKANPDQLELDDGEEIPDDQLTDGPAYKALEIKQDAQGNIILRRVLGNGWMETRLENGSYNGASALGVVGRDPNEFWEDAPKIDFSVGNQWADNYRNFTYKAQKTESGGLMFADYRHEVRNNRGELQQEGRYCTYVFR